MGSRVAGYRGGHRREAVRVGLTALCVFGLSCVGTGSATAEDGDQRVLPHSGQCTSPADPIKGTPWSLQRLLFDEMWADTKGKGVKVAVIDTGVDKTNDQLRTALTGGLDLIDKGDGTVDTAGHGTKVAGIIAARPAEKIGFVGIAPEATIIPIRQNDNERKGNVGTMVQAIDFAISRGADVINISQGTTASLPPNSTLERAVNRALAKDILVVASAGNNGADGKVRKTYPASFEGVLGVGASDRNNERAPFSQSGPFVDLVAPGVDMVSTVPGRGHCADNGTSFAAPYASGVAALLRARHPDWSYQEVIWHLQQTAERVQSDRNNNVGWGVVDPVSALTNQKKPTGETRPDTEEDSAALSGDSIHPATLSLEETPQERRARYGIYVLGTGLFVVAVIVGFACAVRDWRRKQSFITHGEAQHG